MDRKTPATTIVLEWSSADTGVGPSMAAGSQGCRPNKADLPAAARISPSRGTVRSILLNCDSGRHRQSQVPLFNTSQPITSSKPMSPTRLYRIACKLAVFALARPYHHPISLKDITPTPSHPIKSWNQLSAVTKTTIAITKM